MKATKLSMRFLVYGVCLATGLFNCQTKDVDSLTPFTYTFKGFEGVKLPDITPTQPAAVSVTAASMTSSTAAAAVSDGLANMATTGQVPAAVQDAAAAVSKAIPAAKAAQLAASFTPDVMKAMATSGSMPASLKDDVAAIASNLALAAYLPTFTMPVVNGKVINGRIGGSAGWIGVDKASYARADDDACKAAAATAYAQAVTTLDAAKAGQVTSLNQSFDLLSTSIRAETTPCKQGVTTKYDAMRATATQQYNAVVARLEAGKAVLGQATYDLMMVLYAVSQAQSIQGINTIERADNNTCDAVTTAKLASVETARTTDLNRINTNYNATLGTLTKARDQAVASCHNQGNGG